MTYRRGSHGANWSAEEGMTIDRWSMRLRLVLIAAVGWGALGCAARPAPPPQPRYEVQVETVEDQALAAVEATAPDFVVPLSESEDAWARAHLFITQYAAGDGVARDAGPSGMVLSNESNTAERFTYRIERRFEPRGYRFSVTCAPRATSGSRAAADINARNAARFIREGTLEVSLLTR